MFNLPFKICILGMKPNWLNEVELELNTFKRLVNCERRRISRKEFRIIKKISKINHFPKE